MLCPKWEKTIDVSSPLMFREHQISSGKKNPKAKRRDRVIFVLHAWHCHCYVENKASMITHMRSSQDWVHKTLSQNGWGTQCSQR